MGCQKRTIDRTAKSHHQHRHRCTKNVKQDPAIPKEKISINTSQVAHQLTKNSNPSRKKHIQLIRAEEESSLYSSPFTRTELQAFINSLKMEKAADVDELKNEQILTFWWILRLFNQRHGIKSKFIAIPRPGEKRLDDP